jgi:DMSO/TMAO reductase YedYZ heme-binding membrane subunit
LGTIKVISEEDDINKTNAVTLNYDFPHTMTYTELLFETIPGITGVFLVIISIVMAVTSLKWIRKRYYQLFSYTHVILYPIFLALIIVHGCGTWLNWGFPLGSIGLAPAVIITAIQYYMRISLN